MTESPPSPPSSEDSAASRAGARGGRSLIGADQRLYALRLGRRVFFWRIAAILIFLAASVVWMQMALGLGGDYIARVSLQGVITSDQARREMFRKIAEDRSVRGVIIRINSPGGTLTGSEALFSDLRHVSKSDKPVVAVLEEVAASGGYIAALGSDHIVAHHGTITGSIGVVFQWMEFSDLMEKIGIDAHDVTSGPLKGQPSPFGKPSPPALEMAQSVVDDGLTWFIALVAERRGMEKKQVRLLADGRIFTGKRAQEAGLVDAIGGEKEARQWMMAKRNIPLSMPARDVNPSSFPYPLSSETSLASALLRLLPLLRESGVMPMRSGLFAIWKPQS